MFLLIVKSTIVYFSVLAVINMARKCHFDMNTAITKDTVNLLHPGMPVWKLYDIDDYLAVEGPYPLLTYPKGKMLYGDEPSLFVEVEKRFLGNNEPYASSIFLADCGVTDNPYNRHALYISEEGANKHLAAIKERGPIMRDPDVLAEFDSFDDDFYDDDFMPDECGDCTCPICSPET